MTRISLLRPPSIFKSKKRLFVLEDYYEQLKPYFTSKKKQEVIRKEPIAVKETRDHQHREDLRAQIEENQILYSQLLTERLLKVRNG